MSGLSARLRERRARRSEVRTLLAGKLDQLEASGVRYLEGIAERPSEELVSTKSGRTFEIKTYAFWDMEPHDSLLYVKVKVKSADSRFARAAKSGLTVTLHTGEIERHLKFFEPDD